MTPTELVLLTVALWALIALAGALTIGATIRLADTHEQQR